MCTELHPGHGCYPAEKQQQPQQGRLQGTAEQRKPLESWPGPAPFGPWLENQCTCRQAPERRTRRKEGLGGGIRGWGTCCPAPGT